MSMNELVDKQRQLMEQVPHELRHDAFVKMVAGARIVDTLLLYLNSTGHKPWRPHPLSKEIQSSLISELRNRVGFLGSLQHGGIGAFIETPKDLGCPDTDVYKRQLVSTFGVVEEAIEYLNSLTDPKKTTSDRLEELVDILFFWMEQLILGGFTWEQVEKEYDRKWKVNIERYRRAKEDDYEWDKRSEQNL